MQKLIILRGNSGGGKTTIAKMLQHKIGYGTMVISQDIVRREIMWVKDTIGNKAIDVLRILLKHGRKECEIVILEGILNMDKYEELFELAKKLYGENIFSYYFDLPFEETLIRHATKPCVNEYGEDLMKKWWKDNDYLSISKEKMITKEMSKDFILEMILKDIEFSE